MRIEFGLEGAIEQSMYSNATQIASEAVLNLRTIKSLNAEEMIVNKF